MDLNLKLKSKSKICTPSSKWMAAYLSARKRSLFFQQQNNFCLIFFITQNQWNALTTIQIKNTLLSFYNKIKNKCKFLIQKLCKGEVTRANLSRKRSRYLSSFQCKCVTHALRADCTDHACAWKLAMHQINKNCTVGGVRNLGASEALMLLVCLRT